MADRTDHRGMPLVRVPARSQSLDGYSNMLSGIGGPKDKGPISTIFTIAEMTPQQIDAAFRGDWIARKAITIPADDATREWRAWQADKEDITALEKTEKKFKVQERVRKAMLWGRAYGGGALLFGTNDAEDMMQPLEVEKVKKDGLVFLHAVPKNYLNCGDIELDITSEWFGRPQYYEQNDAGRDATRTPREKARLHPSRVIPFYGAERLDTQQSNSNVWSDSILQAIVDAIKSAGLTAASIAHLISEAKIDIINVPGLTETLSTADGEANLTNRFVIANTLKSIINAIILDEGEVWNRHNVAFQGMPDIILVYLMIASAAVDVPATRFLSQSPKGLNATGESDIRNHYDNIRSKQTNEVQPAISPLDEILIRHTFGSRDEAIHYNWKPLWQMNDSEKAELGKKKADIFKIDKDSMLINPDALRKARINQLIEDGTYPGLEEAIDEFGEEPEEPEVDPAALAVQRMALRPSAGAPRLPAPRAPLKALPAPRRDALRVGDAIPAPLYVRRDLVGESAAEFLSWAASQGFKDILDDPHVTILYSRAPVDWMEMGTDDFWSEDGSLKVAGGGPRVVERMSKAIVLLFASQRLKYRHDDMVAKGATHDYSEYQPHVTITYNGDVDLAKVEPFRGELSFGPEIFEAIKPYDPDDEDD